MRSNACRYALSQGLTANSARIFCDVTAFCGLRGAGPHGDRRFWRDLKDVPAPDLGAVAIRAAVERAGLKPEEIETAAMGNVIQAGTKMNPARQAAVQAGLPVTVPAMTVNRVCGSGAQAIVSAAQEILLGNANAAVAGGMESMDQAPYLVGARPLGLSARRRAALRQRAPRRAQRRLLRRALGLAYRGPGGEISGHARSPGPMGAALATAFRARESRRTFQG